MLLTSSLLLVNCSSVYEIPDFNTYVTLPYSGDGYSISTVTHKTNRIPAAQWELQRRKGIVLLSADWEKLKFSLAKNCLSNPCKQTIGALDSLFITIDQSLQQLPIKGP